MPDMMDLRSGTPDGEKAKVYLRTLAEQQQDDRPRCQVDLEGRVCGRLLFEGMCAAHTELGKEW